MALMRTYGAAPQTFFSLPYTLEIPNKVLVYNKKILS